MGGTLRIEKRDSQTNALLEGAKFNVSCDPTVNFPALVISGLEDARPSGAPVTGNPATGFANDGFIAIAGPEGTECTVTELEAPPGYVLPADTSETYVIPRAGSENGTLDSGVATANTFLKDAGGSDVMTSTSVSGSRTATTATITVTGKSMSVIPGWHVTVRQSASVPVERLTE